MKKMKITQMDYIKANRKASRDEEIAEHGWPSRQHAIHKSKKVYDRKRMKAGLRDLPSFVNNDKNMRNNLAKRRIGLRRGPSGSKECGRRDGIRMVACQCGGIYRRLLFLFYLNTED